MLGQEQARKIEDHLNALEGVTVASLLYVSEDNTGYRIFRLSAVTFREAAVIEENLPDGVRLDRQSIRPDKQQRRNCTLLTLPLKAFHE